MSIQPWTDAHLWLNAEALSTLKDEDPDRWRKFLDAFNLMQNAEWTERNCVGQSPNALTAETCEGCPVKTECLMRGIATFYAHRARTDLFWGGLTDAEVVAIAKGEVDPPSQVVGDLVDEGLFLRYYQWVSEIDS